MKKLLIAGVVAAALAAPFVAGAPVREAQARPDCQAVDYNGDGVVDISDIAAAQSLHGGKGRSQILVNELRRALLGSSAGRGPLNDLRPAVARGDTRRVPPGRSGQVDPPAWGILP